MLISAVKKQNQQLTVMSNKTYIKAQKLELELWTYLHIFTQKLTTLLTIFIRS